MTTARPLLPLVLIALVWATPATGQGSCGGSISGTSGTISSPNYPAAYAIGDKCVWVIDVPSTYAVRFTFSALQLSNTPGTNCDDYVEIRDGNRTLPLVFKGCWQNTTTTVTTRGRHSWVKFYSNYRDVFTGFQATWSAYYIGNDTVSVTRICGVTQFRCPNWECTYQSYICDKVNDCGCDGWMCDEGDYYCKAAQISRWQMYTVGSCIGLGLFMIIFFVCAFCESRYNHCPGPFAPQGHGPQEPTKPDDDAAAGDDGECCKCCFCLPCCAENRARAEARAQQEADQRQLEDAYAQIMRLMLDGQRAAVNWHSESEATSRKTSASDIDAITAQPPSEPRRPSYGHTLSPADVPPQVRTVRVRKAPSEASVEV